MTGRNTVVSAAFEFLRRGCSLVVITSSARGADILYLEESLFNSPERSEVTTEESVRVIHQDTFLVEVCIIYCEGNV
jgi:hypothetical protein